MDLRKVLYREKEETLDKLDVLMIIANLDGHSVVVEQRENGVICIPFRKKGYNIALYIREKQINIGTNSIEYMKKIRDYSGDESKMSLDQAIEVIMKIL